MIVARKINKIPEFYMIFARKMPERNLHNNCPKNIFPIFGGAPYTHLYAYDKITLYVTIW